MKYPIHDSRRGAIPIPAVFAPNGPGFKGLYAGDVVQFTVPVHTPLARAKIQSETRTAAILQLLVFTDHVVVNVGPCGLVVDERNFVRLVRRGKRHIAADKARTGFETLPYVRAVDAAALRDSMGLCEHGKRDTCLVCGLHAAGAS